MKRKIISLVIILTLMLSALALVACGGTSAVKRDDLFDDYVRKPETPPAERNADVDADEGVVFDGKFDEEIWQGLSWVEMTSTRSQRDDRYTMPDLVDCTVSATGTMTEKGMYYALITDDPVNWNGNETSDKRDSFMKTGMSVYIADCSYRSIDDGAFEFGFASDGTCMLRKRMLGEYLLYPVMGVGTGVNVDGKLNTAETGGYSIEAFIPWKSLGYDSKPEAIMSMFTIERNEFAREKSPFVWELVCKSYGVSFAAPGTWFRFNEGGRVIAPEGDNFGHLDSKTYYSEGFDLSHDNGDNPYVDSTAGPDAKLYFKNFNETKFYVETKIKVNEIYNGDEFPKTGMMFMGEPTAANGETHYRSVMAMVDVSKDASAIKNFISTETKIDTLSGWDWQSSKSLNAGNDMNVRPDDVKIGVYRNGSRFHYFLNDVYVGERSYDYIGDGTKTRGAILSFNVGARYFDYKFLTGEAAVTKGEQMIKIEPVSYKIDGDESDWAEYSGRVLGSYAYDDSGKEFTAKAILKDDGLFFIAKAKHAVYLKGRTTDWSHNTSLEIGLTTDNGNGSVTLHVTPDESYMCTAVMSTADSGEEGSSTRYTTVTEGFVPISVLKSLKAVTDGKVRVAFSWRTGTGKKNGNDWDLTENDVINSLGRLNDQPYIWYQMDTPAWEKGHRSYVDGSGITMSGKATERVLDGNDDDWASWNGKKAIALGTGSDSGKGFVARFYKGSDGLYFYVKALHRKYLANDREGHMITNFVIETGITTADNDAATGTRQFFFTPVGCMRQGDAVDYVMKTTGTDGNYTTVVEGFIPNAEIYNTDEVRFDKSTGLAKDGYVLRLGAAWRTRGDYIEHKNNNTDEYWQPQDASGYNVYKMYCLTANGIGTPLETL